MPTPAALFSVSVSILQDARAEVVRIAAWNLEWFPGGKPNSSQSERLIHTSAAKDALLDIRSDCWIERGPMSHTCMRKSGSVFSTPPRTNGVARKLLTHAILSWTATLALPL